MLNKLTNEIEIDIKECKKVLSNLNKNEYDYRYYEGMLNGLKRALRYIKKED